ncbi:MAG: hypothetical protein C4329_09310 [Chitinophagaceae bacterium]|mgnify:FL=1
MEKLVQFLNDIYPLSDGLKNKLHEIIKVGDFDKKEIILKAGQVCKNIYFIESGFVRSFYKKDSEEVTTWFMKENDVIISVKSFFCKALVMNSFKQ